MIFRAKKPGSNREKHSKQSIFYMLSFCFVFQDKEDTVKIKNKLIEDQTSTIKKTKEVRNFNLMLDT